MSEHEARQALQILLDGLQGKQVIRRGLLGDSNGTVMVANRPGWAYIRYREDLNRLSLVRYLIQEQLPDETPVVVGRKHPGDPYEQVLGVDYVMYAWSPSQSTVTQYATPVIDTNNLSPGKVVPTTPASLSVDVRAFLYANADVAVEFGGAPIDLTANVPGVAGHRLVLVYVDLSIDGLAAENGDIVAVGVDAEAPDVPENGLPLGIVDLANGAATIVSDDIYQYKILYDAVAGEVPLSSLGDYARGSIIRGGATEWEAHAASGDGWAIVGDGTDVASDLTPNWKGTHTYTVGDDQGIIIVMDAAQSVDAFQIKDSGGNVTSGFDERGIPFADGNAAGANNLIVGPDAGNPAAMAGAENVAIGYQAGDALTNGANNTLVGSGAGSGLTTGLWNTAFGRQALQLCQGGILNVAIGLNALNTHTGNNCVAVGAYALETNTSGQYNLASGVIALRYNQTGDYNVALGYAALQGAVGASDVNYNISIGANSLTVVLTGADYNVAIGYASGTALTTGASVIFLGSFSGSRQTVASNILLVDNQQRADAATELTHSILYGTMAANPEDQQLTINADALNIGTDADADVVMTWQANSNNGVLTWMEDEDRFDFSDTVKTSAARIKATTRIVVGDSPYTTTNADDVIFANTDGGAITVNLQAGVEGRRLRIINCGSSGNALTVEGDGAETVWGQANVALNDGDILVIVYNATEGWW